MIDHNNLEEFQDAVNYDIGEDDAGIAFYSDLAKETGGPILEIACGTGRVAIPIANLGLEVTGLDIVPGMLEQARIKSANLSAKWVEGDARDFDLGEKFSLIFLTGNAFQAFLTREDQEALLARVLVHLSETGLFAFETRNPKWQGSSGELAGRESNSPGFPKLETCRDEELLPSHADGDGNELSVSKTQTYDSVAQILHLTTCRSWLGSKDERTSVTRIALRFTFPQELEALLLYNGFEIIRRYGDWDMSPLSPNSRSIIVVCRKRDGFSDA